MGAVFRKTGRLTLLLGLALLTFSWAAAGAPHEPPDEVQFVNLSLLVASDFPCIWPNLFPPFHINHYLRIGPLSPYNSDILTLDENTGTQFDAPAHGPVPGQTALITPDRVPIWQFVGEACVIDVSHLLDDARKGHSPLILKKHILAWEKAHRPLGAGDVVLFRSGYSDRYYLPLPAGRRFVADPVEGKSPAWPDPVPEAMDYLGSRGVMTAGPTARVWGRYPPPLGSETHAAGLQYGMIWAEGVTALGKLPDTGAFYGQLPPKHRGA